MPWMRRPLPGSIEEAALKIERLMELEEQQRRRPRRRNEVTSEPATVPRSGLLAAIGTPRESAPYTAGPRVARALSSSALARPVASSLSDSLTGDASASALRRLMSNQTSDESAAPSPTVPPKEDEPLGHYLFGDGSARSLSIGDLTLNAPVGLAQFPSVQAILAGQNVGTFAIDENADFQVADDEYGGVLGGISVNSRVN